jgi:type II secretory pathway predicted ATPase ExeA
MKLNQWLLERYRAGKTTVLIVDEAQNLSEELLEEIRLLTNLETSTEKLLQIVLAGQPELEEKLKLPQLRQLRQRIVFKSKTMPLTQDETHGYISERLRIAGANGRQIFSKGTIDVIHQYSQGIPRVVNLLCEHSLINSFAEGVNTVPAKVVEEIAREFHLDEPASGIASAACANLQTDPAQRMEVLMRDIFTFLRPEEQPRSLTGTFRERK